MIYKYIIASNPSQWSINKIKKEMEKYSIDVDDNSNRNHNCVELVALLQEAIDNETKKKIMGTEFIYSVEHSIPELKNCSLFHNQ